MYSIQYIEDVVFYGKDREKLRLNLYIPEALEQFPTIVLFYGGGFTAGRKEDLLTIAEEFAHAGFGVVTPNYRYYPAFPYPVSIEDGAAAVNWTCRHIGEYKGNSRIFVGGHSAGAYIAMMLAFNKQYLSPYDINPDQDIAGWILASGQPTTHFSYLEAEHIDPRKIIVDERAPLYHVRSEGAPLLILCGEHDIENRLMQTRLLVETLRCYQYQNYVHFEILPGQDHGSYLNPGADGHSLLFTKSTEFINQLDEN